VGTQNCHASWSCFIIISMEIDDGKSNLGVNLYIHLSSVNQ